MSRVGVAGLALGVLSEGFKSALGFDRMKGI
jgi:hypothetical protein